MRLHGTAVTMLVVTWLAAGSAQAASIPDSILGGTYGKPVLIDPSTGKARKRPPFKAGGRFDWALRTGDGRSLVTAYQKGGAAWVERYSLASGKSTVIGPFPVTGSQTGPHAVSPDGRRLLTVSVTWGLVPGTMYGSEGPTSVDLLDLDAVTSTPLIGPIPAKDRQEPGDAQTEWFANFRFSPDGRTLAYTHRHQWMLTGAPAGDVPFRKLTTMAADGTGRQHADLRNDGSDIAWAPDGGRIAAGTPSGLQLIDPTGAKAPVKIASGEIDGTAFSSSGRYLAYVPINAQARGKLRIRDLKSGKTITPKLGFTASPSWAPKRDDLAICAGKGYGTLFRVTAKGKAKKLSTKHCVLTWGPTLAP